MMRAQTLTLYQRMRQSRFFGNRGYRLPATSYHQLRQHLLKEPETRKCTGNHRALQIRLAKSRKSISSQLPDGTFSLWAQFGNTPRFLALQREVDLYSRFYFHRLSVEFVWLISPLVDSIDGGWSEFGRP